MFEKEIKHHAIKELQWINYYATVESKYMFEVQYAHYIGSGYIKPSECDNIYTLDPPYEILQTHSDRDNRLRTNRSIPLRMRCASLMLTSKNDFSLTPIEELIPTTQLSGLNIYSALEVILLKSKDLLWMFDHFKAILGPE